MVSQSHSLALTIGHPFSLDELPYTTRGIRTTLCTVRRGQSWRAATTVRLRCAAAANTATNNGRERGPVEATRR